jgi:hypothetical protein
MIIWPAGPTVGCFDRGTVVFCAGGAKAGCTGVTAQSWRWPECGREHAQRADLHKGGASRARGWRVGCARAHLAGVAKPRVRGWIGLVWGRSTSKKKAPGVAGRKDEASHSAKFVNRIRDSALRLS